MYSHVMWREDGHILKRAIFQLIILCKFLLGDLSLFCFGFYMSGHGY